MIKDKDGWVDAKLYLPEPFDLCWLKIAPEKLDFGWHTGTSWDGLRVKNTDNIISWKRKPNSNSSI